MHSLLVASLFLVSADVFFMFHIGGFTFRVFQLLTVPVAIVGLKAMWWDPRLAKQIIGLRPLLLWTFFIVLFIPNSAFVARNVGYAGWLIADVLLVIGLTATINTQEKLENILRWYVWSFAALAVFGLVQLLTPLFGLPGILVVEWWFPGRLPRINGLNYEPSYYATYMLAGWVLIDYLRYRKIFLVPRMNFIFWLVTIAITLSTSRLGWGTMLLWVMIRIYWHIKERGLSVPWKPVISGATALLLIAIVAQRRYKIELGDLDFLASGLGILGHEEAHSSIGRWERAADTFQVFLRHPIVGVSLGGVATDLGQMQNSLVVDQDAAKDNEGGAVLAEVLGASGAIGFIPFALYMYSLMWKPIRTADTSRLGNHIKALTWSLVMVFFALQMSLTITRPTFWLQIGILSAAYRIYMLKKKRAVFARNDALPPLPALGTTGHS